MRRSAGTGWNGLSSDARDGMLSWNRSATAHAGILCGIVDELPIVVMILAVQLLDGFVFFRTGDTYNWTASEASSRESAGIIACSGSTHSVAGIGFIRG